MLNNKMIFGVLVTLIGLVFSVFSLVYASMNPWCINGVCGLSQSLKGTYMDILLTLSLIAMFFGLWICFKEAYKKPKK